MWVLDPDTVFIELMKRSWDALSWAPDDPRLDELASALSANMLANRTLLVIPGFDALSDGTTRYGLINHQQEEKSPTLARLTALVEAKLRAAGVDVPHP